MDGEAEKVEEMVAEVIETTEETSSLQENPSETATCKAFRGHGPTGRGRGPRMMRGGPAGRMMGMKGFRPPGHMRGRGHNGFINGFGPMRRGMGRTWPYPDLRGRRGMRGGPMRMSLGPPPPHMHLRGPPPPMHRHRLPPPPPPPGHMGFRGRPPHLRCRGMMPPGPPRFFHPRGYHNGSASPLPYPPPGRGQRWPGPPVGRRFYNPLR